MRVGGTLERLTPVRPWSCLAHAHTGWEQEVPGGLHPPSHPAALIQWSGVQACASQLPRLESGQVQGAIGAAQNHEGQAAPGTWPGLLNLWLISAPLVASSRARPSEIGCPRVLQGALSGNPALRRPDACLARTFLFPSKSRSSCGPR